MHKLFDVPSLLCLLTSDPLDLLGGAPGLAQTVEVSDTGQTLGNLGADSEAHLSLRAGDLGEWICLVDLDFRALQILAESTSGTGRT